MRAVSFCGTCVIYTWRVFSSNKSNSNHQITLVKKSLLFVINFKLFVLRRGTPAATPAPASAAATPATGGGGFSFPGFGTCHSRTHTHWMLQMCVRVCACGNICMRVGWLCTQSHRMNDLGSPLNIMTRFLSFFSSSP